MVGKHLHVGAPFRFAGRDNAGQPWLRSAAPMVGEHNHPILGDLLHMSGEKIHSLELRGIIGTQPKGL